MMRVIKCCLSQIVNCAEGAMGGKTFGKFRNFPKVNTHGYRRCFFLRYQSVISPLQVRNMSVCHLVFIRISFDVCFGSF